MRPASRLIVLVLAAAALAIAVAAAARALRDDAPPPVPLLWKVSDADNDLYLLGSFHLLRPDDYPLSADVDRAFADAEALVLELSPEEMASPELGIAMRRAGQREDGRALREDLDPALAAKLDAWVEANAGILRAIGMTPDSLQQSEPWYVGLHITLIEMQKLGLDPQLGLDMHMTERARDAGIPASGLELGSEQIAIFDGMSREEQRQFLAESLGEAQKARAEIEALHDAWRRGDDIAMWQDMAVEMRREYPELYRRVNVDRNDAWVPKLQRRLDGETQRDTLAVVGALHLIGEDGVVEKLRAKGYRVERICSDSGCPR
jgi:uncharacterized protein YbaP (TraB family)